MYAVAVLKLNDADKLGRIHVYSEDFPVEVLALERVDDLSILADHASGTALGPVIAAELERTKNPPTTIGSIHIETYGVWTYRTDMPFATQAQMLAEVLSEGEEDRPPLSDEQIDEALGELAVAMNVVKPPVAS